MHVELDPIQHLDIYNSIKAILSLKKETLSLSTQYESKGKLELRLSSLLRENQELLTQLNYKKKLLSEEKLNEYEDTLLQHVEYGKKLQLDLKEMLIDLRLNEYELDVLSRIQFQERQLQLKSYQTELYFYQLDKPNHPPIPKYISSPKPNCYLLSDISVEYPITSGDLSTAEMKLALSWLAAFHSYWYNKIPIQHKGSYWYVDTRQEELSHMKNKKLQSIAYLIDERIHSSKFKTLIHGDFKSENVQFNRALCVVYDFQYVGAGLGAQDVCYLITSSCRSVSDVDDLLSFYHQHLTIDNYSLDQFTIDFDLCLLDYVRFMDGWGYWGNSRWAINRSNYLLDDLINQ
ncbi:hypothetical protein HDV06_000356 [Boothiomyces sp. JEL0866]|nr:hypothetical protein HDV06_000356 [Boothiomyces sp. JEL0866]